MNNTNEYRMLEWMAAALNNESIPAIPLTQWQVFFDDICKYQLSYILFPVVYSMAQDSRPEKIYKVWMNELIRESGNRLVNIEKISELVQSFKENGIPLIVIKGPAISRLYSSKQCRIMTDLDILVKQEDTKQARELIESMGYSADEKEHEREHPVHWGYKKEDGLYLELHRSLLNPLFLGERTTDQWYKSIWQNCQMLSYEGIDFMAMSSEDEMINQVLHFATHLIYGSVKIRNIYDIALLIKSFGKNLKWNYIKEILLQLGLEKFSKLVFSICCKYLAVEVPYQMLMNTDCDYITEDQFLDRFVFENKSNSDTQKGWRVISWKYPYLCKHQFGIPLVLAIELYFEIKKNKGQLKASFFNSIRNTKEFSYKGQLLKRLGLSI